MNIPEFNPEELGFVAQLAYAEAEVNWFYREHLLQIAVEFEQMALGNFPVTVVRVMSLAEDYVSARMDVIDDIIELVSDVRS